MILTIINNIFYVIMLHIYNLSLYGRRNIKSIYLLLSWGIVVLMFLLQGVNDISIPIINICLCTVPYMIITFIMYKATWKCVLIYTVFYYIIAMICELMCYIGLHFIWGIDNIDNWQHLIEVSSNLLLFVVLRIFILISSVDQYDIKLIDFIGIFVVPFGSIILILEFCNPLVNENYIKEVVAICILLVFNVSSYYLYVKIQENIRLECRTGFLEKRNKDYIIESKKITELWEKISEFQHDMKYLSEIDKMRYSNFIVVSGFKNIISKSGCVMIDAIINNKASYAQQLGIDFKVDIQLALDIDYILDDISIILYNLIDNAIEANKKIKGTKYIKLTIENDLRNEETLFIRIVNPYEGIVKKNNNGEYITSKEDKWAHGYGLKSVKQIIDKHKGEIKIEDYENIFKVSIILFDMVNKRKLQNK